MKMLLKNGNCPECNVRHPDFVVCANGHCMYKHAKQVDTEWPIFECEKCGERVFWD